MKKFVSLTLSLGLLTTSTCMSTFAAGEPAPAPVPVVQPEQMIPNNQRSNYIESMLLRFFGANAAATVIDKAAELSAGTRFALGDILGNVKNFSKNVVSMYSAWYILSSIGSDVSQFFKNCFSKNKAKDVTPEKALKILNYEFATLKGQDKAKEQISSAVSQIVYGKEMAKLKNKKYDHGDIIYMPGPSGVGKTFAALRIAHALSPIKPLILSASEVDVQRKESIVQQLFRFNDYNPYDEPDRKISLVNYIKNNKNGVVIINEYDKMWCKALDEIFRTIVDQGVISINGQVLDCSGITFIITSNESSASVNGGNQDTNKGEDDGTGSRTKVTHDKSFMNRVKIVEFENLSQKDYEEIIKSEYDSKFFSYWEDLLKIKLDTGNTVINVAKRAVAQNKGARTIKDIYGKLINKLIMLQAKLNNAPKNPDSTEIPTYVLSYDENIDDFFITLKNNRKNKQTKTREPKSKTLVPLF